MSYLFYSCFYTHLVILKFVKLWSWRASKVDWIHFLQMANPTPGAEMVSLKFNRNDSWAQTRSKPWAQSSVTPNKQRSTNKKGRTINQLSWSCPIYFSSIPYHLCPIILSLPLTFIITFFPHDAKESLVARGHLDSGICGTIDSIPATNYL